MNVKTDTSWHKQKKVLFSSRSSSPVNSPVRKTKQRHSQRCCKVLNHCVGMGSRLSQENHHHHQPTTYQLKQQLADLERKNQQERELRATYEAELQHRQNYLGYCLQIAQENGFLDLILTKYKDTNSSNNNNNQQQSPLSVKINSSPRLPATDSGCPALAAIIDQAKICGWYIEPHEIELQDQIGQGSTANIYRGSWRGMDVAVKCINPDFFHSSDSSDFFFAQEIETLSRQRHPFVLRLIGACLDPPEKAWLVTEFFSMTLKDWLHGQGTRRKERSVPLPPLEERITKALEIAQAMQHLHEQRPKIIHRDLKPSNIFLDDAMHIRVADFGHARFLHAGEQALTGEIGTFVYMAPEVIRSEPYDEKCDVFSFSIILNELITGQHPYSETHYGPTEIALEVGEGKLRPMLPQDDGQLGELIDLVQSSWDQDTSRRPSFVMVTCTLRKIQEKFTQALCL